MQPSPSSGPRLPDPRWFHWAFAAAFALFGSGIGIGILTEATGDKDGNSLVGLIAVVVAPLVALVIGGFGTPVALDLQRRVLVRRPGWWVWRRREEFPLEALEAVSLARVYRSNGPNGGGGYRHPLHLVNGGQRHLLGATISEDWAWRFAIDLSRRLEVPLRDLRDGDVVDRSPAALTGDRPGDPSLENVDLRLGATNPLLPALSALPAVIATAFALLITLGALGAFGHEPVDESPLVVILFMALFPLSGIAVSVALARSHRRKGRRAARLKIADDVLEVAGLRIPRREVLAVEVVGPPGDRLLRILSTRRTLRCGRGLLPAELESARDRLRGSMPPTPSEVDGPSDPTPDSP